MISLYIGKSGVASGFGAAGSPVIVFVWVYYSAHIFLLYAEFTWVYAKSIGSMKNLPKSEQAGNEARLQSFVIDPRSADPAVGDPVSPCVRRSYPS